MWSELFNIISFNVGMLRNNYVNKTARPDSLILVLEIDIAASISKSPGRGSHEQEFIVKVWSLTNTPELK